ncbi:hypothetical protein P168DRAFT_301577 [Aspergillus campestris IBT 28561]|uniref:Uncharacterized protein n=1 Tax=Aspergillus campestris (strain IBT 28561) TaxID=1392248 RepID=A0A2I1DGI6_ASPC2|nr:uncharacterized protein P168DRAFT_301577 [Aspergillus campestris IBT 28561]PKY08981.1 hypothetical protein P168DRAFT_301577 [Aspergillus campestris IBT 28561]
MPALSSTTTTTLPPPWQIQRQTEDHQHQQQGEEDDQQDEKENDIHLHKRTSPPQIPLPKTDYLTISIPSTYGRLNTSPAPGTVVGIMLGSIAGFLFLLYLLYLGLGAGRRFGSVTAGTTATMTTMSTTSASESVDLGGRGGYYRDRKRYRRGRTSGGGGAWVRRPRRGGGGGGGGGDGGVVEVEEEMSPSPGRRYRRGDGGGEVFVGEEESSRGHPEQDHVVEVFEEQSSVDGSRVSRPPPGRRFGRGYRREERDPLAYGSELSS